MNDLKVLLNAFKNISKRLQKLENIGIPKDGKTPIKNIDYFDGKDGKDGKDGENGKDFTFDMFTKEQLDLLKGKTGENGKDGEDGKDGENGKSIEDVYINSKGHLIIIFSDNTEKDVGKVVGKDGKDGKNGFGFYGSPGNDGIGIQDVKILENGDVEVILTSGRKIIAGNITSSGGGGTGNVSSDIIKNIWVGSLEEYNTLKEYYEDTLYFIEG